MSIFRRNKKVGVGEADMTAAVAHKQDKLIDDGVVSTPVNSDYVTGIKNINGDLHYKSFSFLSLWNWIVSKLTSNVEKGLQVASGKLGHSNAITVPTAKRILQATYDEQGHVKAIQTEFNWSNNYTNSAENQLFTRKGANDMYVNYLKSTKGTLTKSTAVTSDYSHYAKCGNIYQLSIGFQNSADIAKDTLLYTLPEAIASASVEMYIVISTINGDTKVLQCGGSSGNNQIKAKQVIPAGYWFGSAIFIKV